MLLLVVMYKSSSTCILLKNWSGGPHISFRTSFPNQTCRLQQILLPVDLVPSGVLDYRSIKQSFLILIDMDGFFFSLTDHMDDDYKNKNNLFPLIHNY